MGDAGTVNGCGSRGAQGCGGAVRSGIPAASASTHCSTLRPAVACGTSLPLPRLAVVEERHEIEGVVLLRHHHIVARAHPLPPEIERVDRLGPL